MAREATIRQVQGALKTGRVRYNQDAAGRVVLHVAGQQRRRVLRLPERLVTPALEAAFGRLLAAALVASVDGVGPTPEYLRARADVTAALESALAA